MSLKRGSGAVPQRGPECRDYAECLSARDRRALIIAMGILSVRLSVRLSRPGTESRPRDIETPGLHRMIA